MKPLTDYRSIIDYLTDNQYKIRDDGSGFYKGSTFIPAEIIPKHSVKSFHELALKNGWVGEEKKDEEESTWTWGYQFVVFGTDLSPNPPKILLPKPLPPLLPFAEESLIITAPDFYMDFYFD